MISYKNIFPWKSGVVVLSTLMLALCVLVPVAQCQSGGVDESYILENGDRLNIKIYPEDEYLKGGEAEISSEGNVTLPLIGKIAIAGKSVLEAERTITEILARDYLMDPQVVIEMLEYKARTFVVLGQVTKPGTYELPAGSKRMTLLEAISVAGGFSEVANIRKIKIMRKSTGEVIRANAEDIISGSSTSIQILADDVIHISESLF